MRFPPKHNDRRPKRGPPATKAKVSKWTVQVVM
jgi:hypothetical protein